MFSLMDSYKINNMRTFILLSVLILDILDVLKACLISRKPKPDFETVTFVLKNWNQIRETFNPAQELDFRFQDGDCHGNR